MLKIKNVNIKMKNDSVKLKDLFWKFTGKLL